MIDKGVDEIVMQWTYGAPKFSNSTMLAADLGFDSLDIVEFTMDVEQKFGIDIADEDAERWKSVGDVKGYLSRRLGLQVAEVK